jgi:hypothetical protein
MSPLELARERVIARALYVVAGRQWRDITPPGPYDEARAEFALDELDDALVDWRVESLKQDNYL